MASDPETLTLEEGGGGLPPDAPLLHRSSDALDAALHRLATFLSLLGFHLSSSSRNLFFCVSLFLFIGVAVPVVAVYLSGCWKGGCDSYQVARFDLFVLASEASLAVISLVCVSHNLQKHGLRRFLFVDHGHGKLERFRKEYVGKIRVFFFLLLWWILPCFLVKVTREIIRFVYAQHDSLWKSVVILLASTVAWIYLTTVFLSACGLFNLVCNLQIIHFEDFGKLLERDVDVFQFLEQHICLRHYLSKISHRFRIYLLLVFVFVSASQFVTLFQTTGFSGIVNFINAGDFAVSSVVQVVGIILCLHSATKISHRAQGISSAASKWHALVTCSSQLGSTKSCGNLETIPSGSIVMNYSESDLESLDDVTLQRNSHSASYMSSYHKRQALVTYMQANPGGITIFGWTVDRALINTIFFIELSLVLFVLGKTIVFSAK